MRKRLKVIVNPVAGRGRARRRAHAVIEHLRASGCRVEIVKARDPDPASGNPDAIIAVGGDGTVSDVVNALPPDPPPLGVIPSGTGNALAKEVILPRTPEKLAALLLEGEPRRWDVAVDRRSGRRFLLFASAGYDAFVVHEFHNWREGKIYQWQYFEWGVKSVLRFQVPRIAVEIDGRPITTAASWVQISNVSAYGGPLVFTPHARPDDGRLDVMVYHAPWKRDLPRMYWRAILLRCFGFDYAMSDLTFHRARRVRLWSADGRAVPSQFDGDPGPSLPLEIEVIPQGVPILLP